MKTYPADWVGEEHADGEIWSAALWNLYLAIGGRSAARAERAAARDAVIKTVTQSHDLLVPTSSMPDGAEAAMQAHALLPAYRGLHLAALLDSFHAREILRCDPTDDLRIGDGSATEDSADVWIRQADDNGVTHEAPLPGQDNHLHARVRNAGAIAARAFVVTFRLRARAAAPATYPDDFLPSVSAGCAFELPPGAERVVKATLPASAVPPIGASMRLLASVYGPTDPPGAGSHVGEDSHLAQHSVGPAGGGP